MTTQIRSLRINMPNFAKSRGTFLSIQGLIEDKIEDLGIKLQKNKKPMV